MMIKVQKRVCSALLIFVLAFVSVIPTFASDDVVAPQKVSDELLGKIGVSNEALFSGDFEDNGDSYSCIIWIEDIDIEEAVTAGIDAAEKTRNTDTRRATYEVNELNGYKMVDVSLAEDENEAYVDAYIESERARASEMYTENNGKFVAECFKRRDVSLNYVSKYSPCVFADLSISAISELMKRSDVSWIGCWEKREGEDDAVAKDYFTTAELENLKKHIQIICADQAKANYGVSGAGVKIGQIESGCPIDADVVKINYIGTTPHANRVYTIMKTVASNAKYYATPIGNNFQASVEALLKQGVNIINMSATCGGNLNTYGEMERWIDHIAYNHDVHFIKSAGNKGINAVTSPGMAYNIVTVGNIEMRQNSSQQYPLHSTSSYNKEGASWYADRTYKPDICAPGTYDSSGDYGTSYATPLVTGTVALMCEYQPALKTKQHIVKAILAASTSKNQRYITTDTNFMRYGTGVVDARAALWIISKGRYIQQTYTITSTTPVRNFNFEVAPSDTRMRVAIAFANKVELSDSSNHENQEVPNAFAGDLFLEVLSPTGTVITSCKVEGANVKVVEFDTAPYGAGTYKIRVTRNHESLNYEINFGVAWR